MADAKWTVRKRSWPNGRVYWIVMRGRGEVIVGPGGGESRYHDRSMAQATANEMNGCTPKEPDPLIDAEALRGEGR